MKKCRNIILSMLFIINNINIVGFIPGKVTCHIFWNLPAPSISAASYKYGFIDVIAAK